MAKYLTKPRETQFSPEIRRQMGQLNARPVVILERFTLDPDKFVAIILKPTNNPLISTKPTSKSKKALRSYFLDDEAVETSSISTYASTVNSMTDNIRRRDNIFNNEVNDKNSTISEPLVHYR